MFCVATQLNCKQKIEVRVNLNLIWCFGMIFGLFCFCANLGLKWATAQNKHDIKLFWKPKLSNNKIFEPVQFFFEVFFFNKYMGFLRVKVVPILFKIMIS